MVVLILLAIAIIFDVALQDWEHWLVPLVIGGVIYYIML
jgi:hypothetical protein